MSFDARTGTRGGKVPNGPLMKLANRLMVRRARKSADASIGPMKLSVLTTIGKRSGEPRETPVGRFVAADGSWLVVASANGAKKNPAWYYNIAAHPHDVTIEIGDRKVAVTAEQLHGQERADAFASIIASAPNVASYGKKTD
ncbi:MAG: nitroreductase/quinone reductase family protein, partial [Aeromicrobium sp.]